MTMLLIASPMGGHKLLECIEVDLISSFLITSPPHLMFGSPDEIQ